MSLYLFYLHINMCQNLLILFQWMSLFLYGWIAGGWEVHSWNCLVEGKWRNFSPTPHHSSKLFPDFLIPDPNFPPIFFYFRRKKDSYRNFPLQTFSWMFLNRITKYFLFKRVILCHHYGLKYIFEFFFFWLIACLSIMFMWAKFQL